VCIALLVASNAQHSCLVIMYFDDDGLGESGADIKGGEKLPLIVTTREMVDLRTLPPGRNNIRSLPVFSERGYADYPRDFSCVIIPTMIVKCSTSINSLRCTNTLVAQPGITV